MLFLLEKDRKTEHNTHFCMPLKPVFTRDCGSGVHFTDEPTGALDSETGNRVIRFLVKCAHDQGLTVLLVTHDMGIANQCDEIIRMENGRIVSQ
jgi:predicted ABC-type transport system involved in lysophospholipase L1 biosynthesis ATPase subunit